MGSLTFLPGLCLLILALVRASKRFFFLFCNVLPIIFLQGALLLALFGWRIEVLLVGNSIAWRGNRWVAGDTAFGVKAAFLRVFSGLTCYGHMELGGDGGWCLKDTCLRCPSFYFFYFTLSRRYLLPGDQLPRCDELVVKLGRVGVLHLTWWQYLDHNDPVPRPDGNRGPSR